MSTSVRNVPEMPQPIDCECCGQLSTVHANQYIYEPHHVGKYDEAQTLVAIVSVIACPKCGVRTQTHQVEPPGSDGRQRKRN